MNRRWEHAGYGSVRKFGCGWEEGRGAPFLEVFITSWESFTSFCFLMRWDILGWRFSKCGPQTSSISWELVRNANAWLPHQTCWMRNSGMRCSSMCFNKPFRWFQHKFRSKNQCCSGNSYDAMKKEDWCYRRECMPEVCKKTGGKRRSRSRQMEHRVH